MPLMIVCTICVGLISRRCTLYEEQVDSQLDSPAHLGDFVVDLLENITVSEVYKPDRTPVFIREETSFEEIVKIVASVKSSYFPVIDAAEDLVGIFTLEDIRIVLISDTDARRLICAADIAVSPVQTVTPEDDLHTVLRICSEYSLTQVPVVEKENPKKVICMLHRGEVISAYDRKLHEYQSD